MMCDVVRVVAVGLMVVWIGVCPLVSRWLAYKQWVQGFALPDFENKKRG